MITIKKIRPLQGGLSLLWMFILAPSLWGQIDKRQDLEFRNFETINSSTNENSLNKIGNEYFLLEVDVHGAKFFSPSIKLSQAVYKTHEIKTFEDLEVEEFYYLLNHDLIYTGAIVSHNLKDYIFSATRRHGDGAIRSGQKLQLYTAQIVDDAFSDIELFPFVQKKHNYCHASLQSNGDLLIFASDMPGGYGGFDLYATNRIGYNDWSEPYNLGPTINSIDDELYPFLSEKGTLFFSSDRFGGIGALDIYKSERVNNDWSAVRNLGPPYNSKSHDFAFRLLDDNGFGTLSSDRYGGKGRGDVYTFVYTSIDKDEAVTAVNESVMAAEPKQMTKTRILRSNFIGLTKEESNSMNSKDAYVIYYQGRDTYYPKEFYRDKEAYLKTLTVLSAQRSKGADLLNLSVEHNQFVQIKIKGYNDIILTPEETRRSPVQLKFVKTGWKHMLGHIIFPEGQSSDGVKVEFKELDGGSEVTAFSDAEGKFSASIRTAKNYDLRLYRDGVQILETFTFDARELNQLVLDVASSASDKTKHLGSVNDMAQIDMEISDPVAEEKPFVVSEIETAESIAEKATMNAPIVESQMNRVSSVDKVVVEPVVEEASYSGDDTGNFYVIGGSFSAEYRAERRRQLLISQGFIDTKLMKVKGRPFFMVMINEYEDLNLALITKEDVLESIDSGYILRKEPTEIQVVSNQ